MKVARFSALGTGRLYPQEMFLVLISDWGWVDPTARVRAAGGITLIGIRTRDNPPRSAVLQATASPRATPSVYIQWGHYFQRPLLAIICSSASVGIVSRGGDCQISRWNFNGLYTSQWTTAMWGRKRTCFASHPKLPCRFFWESKPAHVVWLRLFTCPVPRMIQYEWK